MHAPRLSKTMLCFLQLPSNFLGGRAASRRKYIKSLVLGVYTYMYVLQY